MSQAGIPTREIEINGAKFWLSRIPPEAGLRIFGNLQAKFFPTLAGGLDVVSILKAPGSKEDKIAAASAAALPAFSLLSNSLNGDELIRLCDEVFYAETVTFQNLRLGGAPQKLVKGTYNNAFNSPFDMIELAVEVIEWNYADFLPRFANLFGSLAGRWSEKAGTLVP